MHVTAHVYTTTPQKKSQATTLSGKILSDDQIRNMPAPPGVKGLQWDLSSTQERRQLLEAEQSSEHNQNDSSAHAFSTDNPMDRLAQIVRQYQMSPQAHSQPAEHSATPPSANETNSATPSSPEQDALNQITQQFQQRFSDTAQDKAEFHALMEKTFGGQYDYAKAENIRQQTLNGDFSWMPEITLVDGDQLADISQTQGGVGKGAYSTEKDTVYLSRDILNSDPAEAERILTEEVGHAIDARINVNDAKGDEGDIFSRFVHGEEISNTELAELQQENDSGTIEVNGEEVEVEFFSLSDLDPTKPIKKALDKGKEAIEDIGDAFQDNVIDPFKENIIDPVEKAWDSAWEHAKDLGQEVIDLHKKIHEFHKEGFKKLMESEVIAKIMTVAQFIPIPIVQVVARVYNMARSAYSVYQGVKHGSASAILSGVAGVAGGVSSFAGAAGATNLASKAATFSNYARTASATYKAVSEKDFAAAGELASSWFGGDSKITQGIEMAGKAHAVHEAAENKDYFGAVGMGSALLQDFTGPEGDKLLQGIGDNANVARSVEQAVNTGDYGTAALILNENYGDNLGLSSSQQKGINNTIGTFEQVQTAKDFIDNGDYAQASKVLIDTAKNNTSNPETQQQLDNAGKVILQVDGAVQAAKNGRYAEAIVLGNNALSNPLDGKTRETLADVQQFSDHSRRISKAIDAKDFKAAKQEIGELAEFVGDKPEVMKLVDGTAVSVEDFVYRQIAGRATSAYGELEKLLGTEDVSVDFSDKNFKQWTGGLSIEGSQQMYETMTHGKTISRETIETLFTDPEKSRELLMNEPDLHTVYREVLNWKNPTSIEKILDNPEEWTELSTGKSVFHGSVTRGHRKFISADGYREVVFDSKGKLVEDDTFKGTFNFFSPTEYSNAHIQADVDPYVKYGN